MHLHQTLLLLLLLFSVGMEHANTTRMCLHTFFITKICRLMRNKIEKIGRKPKKAEYIKEKVQEIINEIEAYESND